VKPLLSGGDRFLEPDRLCAVTFGSSPGARKSSQSLVVWACVALDATMIRDGAHLP
jgi:hypothetical protein